MISCIAPDCDFAVSTHDPSLTQKLPADVDDERAKRIVIDHINNDHPGLHVEIACAHDFQHLEFFTTTTKPPDGVEVEVKLERKQCSRCAQFEVSADEREGDDGEAD